MPELPEVETIVSDLQRKVAGRYITGFWTDWEKAVKVPLDRFIREISGRRILSVARRGKNILFVLDHGKVMAVHLKMTGHLLVKEHSGKKTNKLFSEKVNQYIHHIWEVRENSKKEGNGRREMTIEFSDLRKFGKIWLLESDDITQDKELCKLGIEPLSKEFTLPNFRLMLEGKKKLPLRTLLMEQSIIAGIGNIYASEIMFEAGILPKRTISSLTTEEVERIFYYIKQVLTKAVKFRGTSDSDYRDTDGAPGGFQKVLKVYNREGSSCRKRGCDGIVKREKISQRSAFYCEKCQK